MKKSIACLLTIVWLLLAVGCKLPTRISGEESTLNSSEKSASDSPENATVSALLEAIAARDSEAITALFAENAREEASDFRDDVEELLDYMHEKKFQVEEITVPSGGQSIRYGKVIQQKETVRCEITSEGDAYRLAMRNITKDIEEPKNVGIWSLSIIRTVDDPRPERPYNGDCTYRPGICIGAILNPVVDGDEEKAGELSLETVTDLLTAVEKDDRAAALALFSAQSQADFEETWNALRTCFGNGYENLSVDKVEGIMRGPDVDEQWRERGWLSLLVTTEQKKYRLDIEQVYYNSTNEDDVGLRSVTVTECENS